MTSGLYYSDLNYLLIPILQTARKYLLPFGSYSLKSVGCIFTHHPWQCEDVEKPWPGEGKKKGLAIFLSWFYIRLPVVKLGLAYTLQFDQHNTWLDPFYPVSYHEVCDWSGGRWRMAIESNLEPIYWCISDSTLMSTNSTELPLPLNRLEYANSAYHRGQSRRTDIPGRSKLSAARSLRSQKLHVHSITASCGTRSRSAFMSVKLQNKYLSRWTRPSEMNYNI
jgi:hypothetical protein